MAFLDQSQILLAGATGLAGASILQAVLNAHPTSRVRAIMHTRSNPCFGDSRVEYVRGDLRSVDDCRRLVKGCDGVIMAAAMTGGAGMLNAEPWLQISDNVAMNAYLLEACGLEKVRRAVWIGSATLYPESETALTEDALDLNRDPPWAYYGIGWVTRFVEKLCAFWHRRTGLEIIAVRAANIFGPFARFDLETANFIPAIIRKAVNHMDPFEVWGRPDVGRDVVFTVDFARAVLMLMNANALKYEIVNVGSGQLSMVADVVRWALKAAGHQPKEIRYLSDKPISTLTRLLDCTRIRRLIGWQPLCSVEQGIWQTTEWWIDNRDKWAK